jgi:hypothetical protein
MTKKWQKNQIWYVLLNIQGLLHIPLQFLFFILHVYYDTTDWWVYVTGNSVEP